MIDRYFSRTHQAAVSPGSSPRVSQRLNCAREDGKTLVVFRGVLFYSGPKRYGGDLGLVIGTVIRNKPNSLELLSIWIRRLSAGLCVATRRLSVGSVSCSPSHSWQPVLNQGARCCHLLQLLLDRQIGPLSCYWFATQWAVKESLSSMSSASRRGFFFTGPGWFLIQPWFNLVHVSATSVAANPMIQFASGDPQSGSWSSRLSSVDFQNLLIL